MVIFSYLRYEPAVKDRKDSTNLHLQSDLCDDPANWQRALAASQARAAINITNMTALPTEMINHPPFRHTLNVPKFALGTEADLLLRI